MPTDGGLTDEELRDQMITLLVAGHETTATALAWVFHYLLENPSVLATLRAELDAGPLTPDRVVRLEYLDATVKETLRLSPVIAEVGRWVNLLEADAEKRRLNLQVVTDGLALAEAIGARCCVDIAGSFSSESWLGLTRKTSRDAI